MIENCCFFRGAKLRFYPCNANGLRLFIFHNFDGCKLQPEKFSQGFLGPGFSYETDCVKIYHNLSDYFPGSKSIVTVGTFDGVHFGHQKLLKTIKEIAQKDDAETVLLTFSPHPRLVLFPDDNDLRLLTTIEERIERLEKSGLDHLIIHPFSVEFSRTTALEYVQDILVGKLGIHKLVIGYDHHFGRNREGNLKRLQELAPDFGFAVVEISAQEIDDVNISSTKIRNALIAGEVAKANDYLGYAYAISATVVRGNEIGRSIGYPTANLKPADSHKLVPGNGVYAVTIDIEDKEYTGMANIGLRPTVSNTHKTVIEVNIFDFDQDIYSKEARVRFFSRIRDEVKFENTHALQAQLHKDAESARSFLAAHLLN